VNCGGVLVHPGDLIFGDADGVAVIPQGMAEEVVHAVTAKISSENKTRAELEEGKLLLDVYNKYGVL
jgi:4-hydroxy-4-methyl-2-oxoglutarate aldolase